MTTIDPAASETPETNAEPPQRTGSGDAVTVVGGSTRPGGTSRRGRRGRQAGRSVAPPAGPAEPGHDGTTHAARPRGFLVAVALAVVGIAAAGVFAGLYFTKGSGDASTTGGATAAAVRATAKQFTNALFTFDASSLNQNINQAEALSTPKYAQTIGSFYTPDQVARAKQAQASSRADIKSVYIEEIKGDTASVFVVHDDTLANNRNPKTEVDHVRMIVVLNRTGGTWKVANVNMLQAPPDESTASGGTASSTPSSSVPATSAPAPSTAG